MYKYRVHQLILQFMFDTYFNGFVTDSAITEEASLKTFFCLLFLVPGVTPWGIDVSTSPPHLSLCLTHSQHGWSREMLGHPTNWRTYYTHTQEPQKLYHSTQTSAALQPESHLRSICVCSQTSRRLPASVTKLLSVHKYMHVPTCGVFKTSHEWRDESGSILATLSDVEECVSGWKPDNIYLVRHMSTVEHTLVPLWFWGWIIHSTCLHWTAFDLHSNTQEQWKQEWPQLR